MKLQFTLTIFLSLFLGACSYYPDHPEVTSVFPEKNATGVDSAANIQVTFSKEMNTNITSQEFSLYSESGIINGFFMWDNKNKTLIFTPKEPLNETGVYTITVTTYAEDKDGVDLKKEFTSEFYVTADTDRPEIVSHTPLDEATGVATTSAITVTFSEAINLNTLYDYNGFSISPSVEGTFTWNADKTSITFTPTENLDFSTIYTVTIGEAIADTSGNTLKETYTFNFTVGDDTTSPTISSVYQAQTPLPSVTLTESSITSGIEKSTVTGIITSNDIYIAFSELVNTENLETAVSISSSASYYVLYDNSAGYTVARLVFTAPLSSEHTYYLRIATLITDVQNNALNRAYEYAFITNGAYSTAPTITSVKDPTEAPADQEWDLSEGAVKTLNLAFTHENIRITFSRKVDPTTLAVSIQKIYGSGSTTITGSRWPDMTDPLPVEKLTTYEFDLVAGFLAGDVYKLIIKGGSSGLHDIYGNYLAENFVRIFQF